MTTILGMWLLASAALAIAWCRLRSLQKQADKMRHRFVKCLPAIWASQARVKSRSHA